MHMDKSQHCPQMSQIEHRCQIADYCRGLNILREFMNVIHLRNL